MAVAGMLVLAPGCADTAGPVDEPQEQLLFLNGSYTAFGTPQDIYRMNADGTGAENLTRRTALNMDPDVSSDGSRIAFTRLCDIWVMDLSGDNQVQLTNRNGGREEGCNRGPRWSPDGARIAFTSTRQLVSAGLSTVVDDAYVMDADGSNPRNVSRQLGEELGPAVAAVGWSPDGKIVFRTYDISPYGPKNGPSKRVNYRVYVVNADGTGPRLLLAPDDHSPAWSPDGSKVVFIRQGEATSKLYIMNADGSGVRALTSGSEDLLPGVDGRGGLARIEYSPWSPDGTRIAFQSGEHIDVIRVDGSDRRRVTVNPSTFNGWSPRGDRIAFTLRIHTPQGIADDVYVVNADGTGLVNLTDSPAHDSDAVWLPRR